MTELGGNRSKEGLEKKLRRLSLSLKALDFQKLQAKEKQF